MYPPSAIPYFSPSLIVYGNRSPILHTVYIGLFTIALRIPALPYTTFPLPVSKNRFIYRRLVTEWVGGARKKKKVQESENNNRREEYAARGKLNMIG